MLEGNGEIHHRANSTIKARAQHLGKFEAQHKEATRLKKKDLSYPDEAIEQLKTQALTDPLTKFDNRLSLLGEKNIRIGTLEKEFDRAIRHNHDLTVLMVDLDFFKGYNDAFGHQKGDALMELFADAVNHILREEDIKARYGGDEFCFVLPETSPDEAMKVIERLRETYTKFQIDNSVKNPNTLSIGLSSLMNSEPKGHLDLIGFADKALYVSKTTGRNKAIVYGGDEYKSLSSMTPKLE